MVWYAGCKWQKPSYLYEKCWLMSAPFSLLRKLTAKLGIWRNQADARPASMGAGHKAAMRATISLYSEWKIERLKLEIGERVNKWNVVEWED